MEYGVHGVLTLFQYKIHEKKNLLHLRFGGSFYSSFLKEPNTLITGAGAEDMVIIGSSQKSLDKFNFSVLAGISYSLKLKENLFFDITPSLEYFLKKEEHIFTKSSTNNLVISLNFGVSYLVNQ